MGRSPWHRHGGGGVADEREQPSRPGAPAGPTCHGPGAARWGRWSPPSPGRGQLDQPPAGGWWPERRAKPADGAAARLLTWSPDRPRPWALAARPSRSPRGWCEPRMSEGRGVAAGTLLEGSQAPRRGGELMPSATSRAARHLPSGPLQSDALVPFCFCHGPMADGPHPVDRQAASPWPPRGDDRLSDRPLGVAATTELPCAQTRQPLAAVLGEGAGRRTFHPPEGSKPRGLLGQETSPVREPGRGLETRPMKRSPASVYQRWNSSWSKAGPPPMRPLRGASSCRILRWPGPGRRPAGAPDFPLPLGDR